MLNCTEEGMCVGVGDFMFWQILPSISLYVWFLEGFDLYMIYISIYIYIFIYIYIYTTNLFCHEQVCLMMFNEGYSFERYFFHHWTWLNMFMMW